MKVKVNKERNIKLKNPHNQDKIPQATRSITKRNKLIIDKKEFSNSLF